VILRKRGATCFVAGTVVVAVQPCSLCPRKVEQAVEADGRLGLRGVNGSKPIDVLNPKCSRIWIVVLSKRSPKRGSRLVTLLIRRPNERPYEHDEER
jgi:hypothetical protein